MSLLMNLSLNNTESLKRGIENAGTRRGHVSPLDMHANLGPGQISDALLG